MTSNCSPTQCTGPKVILILKPADDQAFPIKSQIRKLTKPPRFCLYFIVLRGLRTLMTRRAISTGSVATARAGQRVGVRRKETPCVACLETASGKVTSRLTLRGTCGATRDVVLNDRLQHKNWTDGNGKIERRSMMRVTNHTYIGWQRLGPQVVWIKSRIKPKAGRRVCVCFVFVFMCIVCVSVLCLCGFVCVCVCVFTETKNLLDADGICVGVRSGGWTVATVATPSCAT